MEIKNIIIFASLLLVSSSCSPFKLAKGNGINKAINSIESVILESDLKIRKHLIRNNRSLKNDSIIFFIIGQQMSDSLDPCAIFESNNILQFLIDDFSYGSNLVTGYLLDEDNKYIAKSSSHTLIEKPNELSSYKKELLQIELAINNEYLAFIKVMNCNKPYLIAYKREKVDIYYFENEKYILGDF